MWQSSFYKEVQAPIVAMLNAQIQLKVSNSMFLGPEILLYYMQALALVISQDCMELLPQK